MTSFGGNISLYNVLINEVVNDSPIYSYGSSSVTCQNMTCDNPNGMSGFIWTAGAPAGPLTLINCLITQPDPDNGRYEVSSDAVHFTESLTPTYQTVGAGSYYLAGGNPFHHAGTAGIDSTLLADLATKTT